MYKQVSITDKLLHYIRENSLRENSVLQELREETATLPEAVMQISPEQGQFLKLLVSLVQAKNALEIGVFTGYSSLCIAESLPKDGTLIACDINKEWTDMAARYWKRAQLDNRIELHLNDALITLKELLKQNKKGFFDVIFIDADKENYHNYYELSLQLLRPRGLIIFDNTLWSGQVAEQSIADPSTNALRELNRKLHHDDRVELSLLPYADGLTLLCKK